MAVTIHHLEVSLEVEGTDDESAFTRMFNQHITRWNRANEERKERQKLSDCERRLTGPEEAEDA